MQIENLYDHPGRVTDDGIPLNILVLFVRLDVSQLKIGFNEVIFLQPLNILDVLVTFEVSQSEAPFILARLEAL